MGRWGIVPCAVGQTGPMTAGTRMGLGAVTTDEWIREFKALFKSSVQACSGPNQSAAVHDSCLSLVRPNRSSLSKLDLHSPLSTPQLAVPTRQTFYPTHRSFTYPIRLPLSLDSILSYGSPNRRQP